MVICLEPELERIGKPPSQEELDHLKASLLQDGFLEPLTVWFTPGGSRVLLDGYRRVAAWALLCMERGKWARLDEVARIEALSLPSLKAAREWRIRNKQRKMH